MQAHIKEDDRITPIDLSELTVRHRHGVLTCPEIATPENIRQAKCITVPSYMDGQFSLRLEGDEDGCLFFRVKNPGWESLVYAAHTHEAVGYEPIPRPQALQF